VNKIGVGKFKLKYPRNLRPNNKNYKRMLRRIRKDLPRFNG
jgi:hypothetical protein